MIWLSALGAARITTALLAMLLFAALCIATVRRERRRQRAELKLAESLLPAGDAAAPLLVAHASQTGTAEQLAWQTARALQLAGVAAQVCSLAAVTREHLQRAGRALFIASTYGEGDPPDAAAPFVRGTMLAGTGGSLAGLHFGVLALGDSSYQQYCGFGRALDQWLRDAGARPLFERIEADKVAEAAVEQWRQQLAHIAGTRDAPDWSGPEFGRWQLLRREHLNPGSQGEKVCHLELRPATAPLPGWEAGDLLQMRVPGDAQPREYSIASIPADGSVHLLVRQARRADGSPGHASGWLLTTAAVGDEFDARIREHRGFRLADNAQRALILVGNGTGMAGLRSLLKARATLPPASGADPRCWLIFGERSARHDAFYTTDIAHWQQEGLLTHCDLVYSRDQPQRRYVQHCLAERGDDVRSWIDAGAALYVCGSLKGMAAEVDAVLEDILGRARLDELTVAGRYRRDVY
ncbi:MAG: sulfite reductase subunit alpha [Steroidobacteraceae bacterium]